MKGNKSFLLIAVAFALTMGFYTAFGNLIGTIFTPFHMTAHDIAMTGLYLLGSGVVGAMLIATWVDRSNTYKLTTVVLGLANVIFLGIMN